MWLRWYKRNHLFGLNSCLSKCVLHDRRFTSAEKMVFSDYAKQRILSLYWKGLKISAIVEYLVLEDGIRVSKQGTRLFLKRYSHYQTIARKPGSGLPPRLSPAVQQLIEAAMRQDDETTATQLQAILAHYQVYVSLATIVRNRRELGWVYRGSAYCQLIRNANKEKRSDFARTYLHDNFDDVIWSDETTVQLETHKRMCYRKEGEKPRPKPRAKHPVKVHVWGGISRKGATAVCIFEGIMTAPLYCDILERTLFKKSSLLPTPTVSCRTTIRNTHRVSLRSSLPPIMLIGGVLHPNLPI